jgi:serine/threonine-protein kinase
VAGDPPSRGRRLLAELEPGTRIAGYLIEEPVGAGGMAAVFRAHDDALDRVVALKVVYAGSGIDQVVRERFVREALAIAKVDHPHIIPVYAAGESDDMMFIAMRYVEGGDLRSLVKRGGPVPLARAAAIISGVASALDAAHDRGLVHRDVKPANVLVDDGKGRWEGHAYLSDFGLARQALAAGGLTQEGQFVGTPDYASPEQIRGQLTGGQCDQYSLACVAYTLLTGQVPYIRENPMAVLYAHLDAPPPVATRIRPELPAAVDAVLATALAKDPARRYGSCGEFAAALRDALGLYDITGPFGMGASAGAATAGIGVVPTGTAAVTTAAGAVPDAGAVVRGEWSAVITADRAYYDGVRAANEQDAEVIHFPDHYTARRIPLSRLAAERASAAGGGAAGGGIAGIAGGTGRGGAAPGADGGVAGGGVGGGAGVAELSVGRRSRSRHIEPDIDLTGDPGVSRQHASLTFAPDGTCSITDQGSPNGTLVNGAEIPVGKSVPLRDGDHVNLGAWTRLTITRG